MERCRVRRVSISHVRSLSNTMSLRRSFRTTHHESQDRELSVFKCRRGIEELLPDFRLCADESAFMAYCLDSKNCVDMLYASRCQWCSNRLTSWTATTSTIPVSQATAGVLLHPRLHRLRNCFGCNNLRNIQYCFFNKPCTREEYFAS